MSEDLGGYQLRGISLSPFNGGIESRWKAVHVFLMELTDKIRCRSCRRELGVGTRAYRVNGDTYCSGCWENLLHRRSARPVPQPEARSKRSEAVGRGYRYKRTDRGSR